MTIIITTNPHLVGVQATTHSGLLHKITLGKAPVLSGETVTAIAGILTPAFGFAGAQAIAAAGLLQIGIDTAPSISGQAATAAVGFLRHSTVAPMTGVEATTGQGLAVSTDPQHMFGVVAVASTGQFPFLDTLILVGRQANSRVGVFGFEVSFGQQATAEVGSFNPSSTRPLHGVGVAALTGQLLVVPRNVQVQGVQAVTGVGHFGIEIFF